MTEHFDPRARAKSFTYAFRGLRELVSHEHNARIHVVVAVAVVLLAWFLGITPAEWALLALTIGSVLCAEAMNSAIESLADAVHPDDHPMIARAKDVAAGGVLLTAIAAAIVGALVLGPPLLQVLFGD